VRAFIDQRRERFGVEPICTQLQVAPSAYWRHVARQRDPALLSTQARRDAFLMPHIHHVWQANFQVYGADKVWRQLQREGIQVARCTVERLMRRLGLHGVRRGGTLSAGSGQSAVQGRPAKPALGFGLHLRLHLGGLCLCRLRH
jgi:hypothetical protein